MLNHHDLDQVFTKKAVYFNKLPIVTKIDSCGQNQIVITNPRRMGKSLTLSTLFYLNLLGYRGLAAYARQCQMESFALELESLKSDVEKQFPDHPPLHGPVPSIKFDRFEKFLYKVYKSKEEIESIQRIKRLYQFYLAEEGNARAGFTQDNDGIMLIDEFDDNARIIKNRSKQYSNDLKDFLGDFKGNGRTVVAGIQKLRNLGISSPVNNFTEFHNIVKGYNKLAITKSQIYGNPIIHTLRAFFEKHKQIPINNPEVQQYLGVKKVTSAQQYIDLLFELHDGFWMDPKKQPLKDEMVISPKVLNINIKRLLENQSQIPVFQIDDYTSTAITADLTQQFECYKKIQGRPNEGFLILSKLARDQTIRTPSKLIMKAHSPSQISPINILYNAGYVSVKQIQGDHLILGPPNIGVLNQLREQKERADLLLPEFIRNLVYTEEEIKIQNKKLDPLKKIADSLFDMFKQKKQKVLEILGEDLESRSQRNLAGAFDQIISQAIHDNCKEFFRYQVEPDIIKFRADLNDSKEKEKDMDQGQLKKIVFKPDGIIFDDSNKIKMLLEYYITQPTKHRSRYLDLLQQVPYIVLIGLTKEMKKVKIQVIRQLFEGEENREYIKTYRLNKKEGGVYQLRTSGRIEYSLPKGD